MEPLERRLLFGAPSLALLERRLLFSAPQDPFGAGTPSGAPLALLEPLERRLLLEPLFFWLFWSGGSSSEPLLQSPSGSSGAEARIGAPLALQERRLFFGAPLAPFGAETPFRALLALQERRFFSGAPLAPLGT